MSWESGGGRGGKSLKFGDGVRSCSCWPIRSCHWCSWSADFGIYPIVTNHLHPSSAINSLVLSLIIILQVLWIHIRAFEVCDYFNCRSELNIWDLPNQTFIGLSAWSHVIAKIILNDCSGREWSCGGFTPQAAATCSHANCLQKNKKTSECWLWWIQSHTHSQRLDTWNSATIQCLAFFMIDWST